MLVKPRKRCPYKGVAIANHSAIVNVLRIVNLVARSVFSTAGSSGYDPTPSPKLRTNLPTTARPTCNHLKSNSNTVGIKSIADPEDCFQEFISDKLMILLRDRPCRNELSCQPLSGFALLAGQSTGISLESVNFSKDVLKMQGPLFPELSQRGQQKSPRKHPLEEGHENRFERLFLLPLDRITSSILNKNLS